MIRFLKSTDGVGALIFLFVSVLLGLFLLGVFDSSLEKATRNKKLHEVTSFKKVLSAARQQSFKRATSSDQKKATVDFVHSWNAIASSSYWSELTTNAGNAKSNDKEIALRSTIQKYCEISRDMPETPPRDQVANSVLTELEDHIDEVLFNLGERYEISVVLAVGVIAFGLFILWLSWGLYKTDRLVRFHVG